MPSISQIVADGLIRAVFQPIVDIDSGTVVGVEALARGPIGSGLESPADLFSAARAAGITCELDWVCRTAAIRGALDAGLASDVHLFVNAEPSSFSRPMPTELDDLLHEGMGELSIVVELTEREIAADPAALLAAVRGIRSFGYRIAIDDVGADPASLALLPFIQPDVVKLDMSLVQRPMNAEIAAIGAAVSADAERRGTLVLAEGIETDLDRRRAIMLGADLGQGWLFGHPAGLEVITTRPPTDATAPVEIRDVPGDVAATPWSLAQRSPRRRTTTKKLLMPMSRHIEQAAIGASRETVLLGAFQHSRYFSPSTAERYGRLADRCSFVAAFGAGIRAQPAPGVRGAHLAAGHPLLCEWTVVVLGPHFAAALIAIDREDSAAERDRSFDYVITHDRELVTEAARSLVQYIVNPVPA